MLRNPIPLLLLAALIWIFGGTYLHSISGCCGGFVPNSLLSVKDGAQTVAASKTSNLLFGLSGATPEMPGDVKAKFGMVAEHLKKNPSKTLTLTGLYGSEEKNNTKFDNLGLGRADAIKQYLVGLGVPATQLLTGSTIRNGLEVHEEKLYGGIDYAFVELATNYISIKDAAAFGAGTDDNFVFSRSGFEYKKPISDRLKGELTKTAEYLKKNPNRSLRITGHYHSKEKNVSAMPNLGLGRANNIKGLLTGMGVAATQITLDSKEKNDLLFVKEELTGGANYDFFDTPKDTGDRLAEIEKKLRAKPLVLYFQTNAENLNLSAEQKQWFADLMYYLERKAGAKVSSIGHTDNRGEDALNRRLSRKRAEFARDYLVKNGIATNKILATGKGPDVPIATNDTPAGRSQNRRVEVSIN